MMVRAAFHNTECLVKSRSISLALVFTLAGCAPPHLCPSDQQVARLDTLYFGTAKHPTGKVTREEWRAFVGEVITPRFPQGLTWWKAKGQWRNTAGTIERETTYVLQIAHPETLPVDTALRDIARQYRETFGQEAVLRIGTPACLSSLTATVPK